MLDVVRQRVRDQHFRNQGSEAHLERLLQYANPYDPNVLTIGFARRFATYKRATLLFDNPEWIDEILTDSKHPVLFIFAGLAVWVVLDTFAVLFAQKGPVAGLAVDLAGTGQGAGAWAEYLEAQRAARAGDRAGTERAVQRIEALSDSSKQLEILTKIAQARLLELDGHREAAIALLQNAAAIEDGLPLEFGPPVIVEPSHELLGELFLRAGKPADAQRQLLRQLALTPGRSRTLGSLARAAFAAGDRAAADRAYRDLERNWLGADPDVRLTLNAIHRELTSAP